MVEIAYGFRDPLTGYDPPPSAASSASQPDVSGWNLPLIRYPIGHRTVAAAEVLPVGVVVEGEWLCDCLQYLPPHWPEAVWMERIAGHRLVNDGEGLRLKADNPAPPLSLEGSWCVLNDFVGYRNIAHFFSDELPQLAAIRELQRSDPSLRVLARPSAYANINRLRELLLPKAFVDGRPAVAMADSPSLRPERLHLQPVGYNGAAGFYPDFHSDQWWLALGEYRRGLAWLRQALDEQTPEFVGPRGHWICFSRDLHRSTEAPQGRQFTNYPELLETLSNAGVIVLDPGRFAIDEIHGLILGARGFIGVHGAGLANALLAPVGCRVVEIRTHSGVSPVLELMGKAGGLEWHSVDPPQATDGSDRGVIPIEAVMALIADQP